MEYLCTIFLGSGTYHLNRNVRIHVYLYMNVVCLTHVGTKFDWTGVIAYEFGSLIGNWLVE